MPELPPVSDFLEMQQVVHDLWLRIDGVRSYEPEGLFLQDAEVRIGSLVLAGIDEITRYCRGAGTLNGCPHINIASLRAKVYGRLPCIGVMLGAIVGFYAALPPYGAVLGVAILWTGIDTVRSRHTPSL